MTSLQHIPFVTGIPGDDQKTITWVRNGELLEGASTKTGHDGVLNSAPSQLQENIVVVDKNTRILELGLAVVNESVKEIEEAINSSGTADIIAAVKSHGESIELHDQHFIDVDKSIDELETSTTELDVDIGVRSENSGPNSIFDDLVFIKTRIGNNAGEDINGLPAESEASGLIRKIQDTTTQAINNKNSIDNILKTIDDADLDTTKTEVHSIRAELGNKTLANGTTVYVRLDNIESHDSEVDTTIGKIKTSIGLDSRNIGEDVNKNTLVVAELKTVLEAPSTGLIDKVSSIETTLNAPTSGVLAKVDTLETNLAGLDTRVGKTGTGLVGVIEALNVFVGKNNGKPSADSLSGRLTTLTALHNDTASTVQDMQSELGTANSDIIGDIKTIKATQAAQDVQLKDFDTRLKALEEKVKALESV